MRFHSYVTVVLWLMFFTVLTQPLAAIQTTKDPVSNQLLPTGRRLSPAGETITFHGRPIDLAMSNDRELLLVKDRGHLRIVDAKTFKLIQSVASSGGASLYGLSLIHI